MTTPSHEDRDWDDLLAAHDALRGRIAAALKVCERHEWGALRWADPLPVPEWIAEVRAALHPQAWDPKAVFANKESQR